MGTVTVELVEQVDDETLRALVGLLPQVSSSAPPLTRERVEKVLATPSTSLLVARLDGRAVGMALLLTLTTFSMESGYVEEVAVDSSARRFHVGTELMLALLKLASGRGLRFVDLTSRPAREAANGLYQSLGFELRNTNCYRHSLAGVPGSAP